jgi:hypothetical protein
VLEEAVQGRPRPVDRERPEAHAERARERGHEGVSNDALERVLTDGGRDVHDRIRVVDPMDLPEGRHLVHGDVGQVVREVEEHHRGDAGGHRTERREPQEAEAPGLQPREEEEERRVEQHVGPESEEREREVRDEVGAVPPAAGVKGNDGLDERDERHGAEDGADRGEVRLQHRRGGHAGLLCTDGRSGASFAGSRTTRMATMRPARVST